MSERELGRIKIIEDIEAGRVSVVQGAVFANLGRRQMTRLVKAYRDEGASGLISKKRGKPSNRKYSDSHRNYILELVRQHYPDFGPTLALEKLEAHHEVSLSRETLRLWMSEAGLWKSRKLKRLRVYQPRQRRDCFGELIQIDGSHHPWFEDRGQKCALLVYVDDATSKLVHLRFCKSENAFDYFEATKSYLGTYGKPLAFYSDKHAVFRTAQVSKKDATTGMTQFGRALDELNIDIICANSPQAKGRVERANRTLQDRLVKELRLRKIDTMADANAFMPEFMADYNARFGKEPRKPKDMHRPLSSDDNLDGSMCHKNERTVSSRLTVRYNKILFILDPSKCPVNLARKRVTVCDYPDGRLEIEYDGVALPYTIFDTLQRVKRADIVENKRLDETLAMIADMQEERNLKRDESARRRTGQTGHMF